MGTKTRGNKNEGETYRVRTGSELAGVVSERVLTQNVNHGSPANPLANILNAPACVTGYIFPNIFRIFRTFSTLIISAFYAFPSMFSTSFIMFIPTHMANFLN